LDNTTNTATPTITGAAEAGSTVGVYDSTGTFVANATVAGDGTWSFLSPTTLATGAHTFTVKVTDAAGNTDIAASNATITLTVPVLASYAVDAVTNISANYASSSNTLVLTGTNYTKMLDTTTSPAETSATEIKGRLDWTKLVWDMNGDDNAANDVTFALADIASAKVTNDGSLTIILTLAKAKALEGNALYSGTTTGIIDTIDIANGFAGDSAGHKATSDAHANEVLTIPSSADVATAALAAFDSYDSTYTTAAGNYANLQTALVGMLVETIPAADISLGKAASFLVAAQAMFDAATAQMTAATALGAAAADTPSTADDAGAAERVAKANTRLAEASTNLASANRSHANMTKYAAAFHGDLVHADAAAEVVDLATYDAALVNSLFVNSALIGGALTFADGLFANKSNIETLLVGNTGGAKTLTFGAEFNRSGATDIYSSARGAQTVDATAVTRAVNFTFTNPTGALTFSGGTGDTNVTGLMASGAPTVTVGNGTNHMDILVQSGAITASAGDGTNTINTETTDLTGGAITVASGRGNNTISAMTGGGAITIETATGTGTAPPAGTEIIKAYSQTGAVTVNIATKLSTSAFGSAADLITIDTNTNAFAPGSGITIIHGSNGRHVIHSNTYNSSITIDTHDANDSVSASSGGGAIIVNTGGGNDTIFVASGTGGATIDGGTGTNTITLGAHSSVADTINARTAYATLVNGATIGTVLPDHYLFAATTSAPVTTTPLASTMITGTSTTSIDELGILHFDATPSNTGATFAAEVLAFLKATPTTYSTVASYDDGVNQWVFSATDATTGRYIELMDTHDALFAGASGTAGAHKILLGA
jgi:hypothetical protein